MKKLKVLLFTLLLLIGICPVNINADEIGIADTQLKLNIKKTDGTISIISASSSELTSVEMEDGKTYTIQDEVNLSNYDDTYEYSTESILYLNENSLETIISANVTQSFTVVFNTTLTQAGTYSIVTKLYKVGDAEPLSVHNSNLDILSESIELKESEKVDISFTTEWVDSDESERPEKIMVLLYADGNINDAIVVNKTEQYAGSFNQKPLKKDGVTIEYTIKEVTVSNYASQVSGNVEDGFVITNTRKPDSTITLTKQLNGKSEENEFGIYLLPIRNNNLRSISLYIIKLYRRYPNTLLSVSIVSMCDLLDKLKEYDKTSGTTPLYPVYSQLLNEEFLKEKLALLPKDDKGNVILDGYNDEQLNLSEEEKEQLKTAMVYYLGMYTMEDMDYRELDNLFAYDILYLDEELLKMYERYMDSRLQQFVYPGELQGYDNLDDFVNFGVLNNKVFYVLLKNGETKSITIPADELISLAIVETDYEDIKEFKIIYYNKPTLTDAGTIDFGDGETKNNFDYTLINEGKKPIEISKIDASTNKILSGATLAILDSNGEVVEKWLSANEPHEVYLEPGTYTLKEIKAPKGYEVAKDIIFTVDEDMLYKGHTIKMSDKLQPQPKPDEPKTYSLPKTGVE